MHRRHTVICPPDRLSGHGLHKHTNLAILALMLTLYCLVVALYLQHKMLVNVKVDVSG